VTRKIGPASFLAEISPAAPLSTCGFFPPRSRQIQVNDESPAPPSWVWAGESIFCRRLHVALRASRKWPEPGSAPRTESPR
jgi:hypothetical protein